MGTTTTGERDWKWLLENFLPSILSYLINSEDYIRFSVVCKQWHSVAKDPKQLDHHMATRSQQVPLLLLPPKEDDYPTRSSEPWSVYSVADQRLLGFKLRVPHRGRHCYRSSFGWLVFRDNVDPLVITLFNPFTRAEISLPKIRYPAKLDKVILSADPSLLPNDYVVVVGMIVGRGCRLCQDGILASIQPGRDDDDHPWTWTYFSERYSAFYVERYRVPADIICFFGEGKRYVAVVGTRGEVMRADVDYPFYYGVLEVMEKELDISSNRYYWAGTRLKDNLLLVSGSGWNKMRVSTEHSEDQEVKDLNGDTVFLGHSCCIAARDFPGIEADCVYGLENGSRRIMKFNVVDKTLSQFDTIPDGRQVFGDRWFWIFPTINM